MDILNTKKINNKRVGNTGARLLLALSLILAPQALWGENSTPDRSCPDTGAQNFTQQNPAKQGYAGIAKKIAKGAWHTLQLGTAAMIVYQVIHEGFEFDDMNMQQDIPIFAIVAFSVANGAMGLNELCNNTTDAANGDTLAPSEKTQLKKIARGAWYTAQLAALGFSVREYGKLRQVSFGDRLIFVSLGGTLLSNSIFGFKDLFCKKSCNQEGIKNAN